MLYNEDVAMSLELKSSVSQYVLSQGPYCPYCAHYIWIHDLGS